jgi:hypothetical protein
MIKLQTLSLTVHVKWKIILRLQSLSESPLEVKKTISDHKGCIAIYKKNIHIIVWIIFIVSETHGLLLY